MWAAALVAVSALAVGWSAMSGDTPETAPSNDDGPPIDPPAPVEAPAPRVESAPSTAPSGAPALVDPGSATTSAAPEAPAGRERTEAGARSAAVGYLELTEDAVSMTPADAAAVQRSIATADFAEEFGADTERRMVELAAAVPGGVVLRVAPIAVRSVADGDDWLMSVWYVQTITMVGEAVVDDWRTADYRMRWEGDAWKIASFTSDRGPMPGRGTQPASATATDFEAGLDGFTDMGLG
jgi:hypothetical protein